VFLQRRDVTNLDSPFALCNPYLGLALPESILGFEVGTRVQEVAAVRNANREVGNTLPGLEFSQCRLSHIRA